jgi:hypothetical protein
MKPHFLRSYFMSDENIPPDTVPFEVSHPHLKEFIGFLPELNKESDRGCVMSRVVTLTSYYAGFCWHFLSRFLQALT